MTRALIINDAVRRAIAKAIKQAEAQPLTLTKAADHGNVIAAKGELKLADRKPGFERPESQHVDIPVGYRAAYSVEEQPIGLCHHLSISVDKKGKVPTPQAITMIAKEYGIEFDIDSPRHDVTVWLEEFEPGHHAINLVTPKAKP